MLPKPPPGLEIIPRHLLRGLTPDKLDVERGTLRDANGDLWVDVKINRVGVEALVAKRAGKTSFRGKAEVPFVACGRRLRQQ